MRQCEKVFVQEVKTRKCIVKNRKRTEMRNRIVQKQGEKKEGQSKYRKREI